MNNEEELTAKRAALVAILVRNRDVLDWYIQAMLRNMPQMYLNMMFKAFAMIDKNNPIKEDNLWALIPAFLSQLSTEQFGYFMDHMSGIAYAVNAEYKDYIQQQIESSPSTAQSLPSAGPSHDSDRTDGERKDHPRERDTTNSYVSAVSSDDTGHQRGETVQ